MIRKKREIEREIKEMRKQLDTEIVECVEIEKMHNRGIKELEEEINKLRSEICLEDTLEGRIRNLEHEAYKKVFTIFDELSMVTGKDYFMTPSSDSYKNKPSRYSVGTAGKEMFKL